MLAAANNVIERIVFFVRFCFKMLVFVFNDVFEGKGMDFCLFHQKKSLPSAPIGSSWEQLGVSWEWILAVFAGGLLGERAVSHGKCPQSLQIKQMGRQHVLIY